MASYHRNPRYAESVRRQEEARRRAIKELIGLHPDLWKELLAKHKADVYKEKGDLPTIVDNYSFTEVRQRSNNGD